MHAYAPLFFCLLVCFEAGSHQVALSGLKLTETHLSLLLDYTSIVISCPTFLYYAFSAKMNKKYPFFLEMLLLRDIITARGKVTDIIIVIILETT